MGTHFDCFTSCHGTLSCLLILRNLWEFIASQRRFTLTSLYAIQMDWTTCVKGEQTNDSTLTKIIYERIQDTAFYTVKNCFFSTEVTLCMSHVPWFSLRHAFIFRFNAFKQNLHFKKLCCQLNYPPLAA